MRKTVDEATQLFDRMAFDSCLWSSERVHPPKQMGRLEVDTVTSLQAQIFVLTKQLDNLTNKNNPTSSSENYNFMAYSNNNNEFGVSDTGFIGDGYIE